MSPVPGGEDTDWKEIWKARQKRHESSKHFEDSSHNWDDKKNAARYDSNSRSMFDVRVKTTIDGLAFTEESTVLDIGAGPGTLAIPLAPLVKEVVAIEPSAGMVDVLHEHLKKNGIENVRCIRKRWEDIDPSQDLGGQKYDLVIASLSLTMSDIREALEKMNAVSRGSVYLFWFVDSPFWEKMYADLWKPLHNATYFPGPKADCLWNVLFQMGIYADVGMLPLAKEYRFPNQDEMYAFFRKRFHAETPAQEKVLRDYIRKIVRVTGGEVVMSGDSVFAKIWWQK